MEDNMKDTASTFASYGDDSVDLNENEGYTEEITDEENFNEGSHDEANDLGENESFDFTDVEEVYPEGNGESDDFDDLSDTGAEDNGDITLDTPDGESKTNDESIDGESGADAKSHNKKDKRSKKDKKKNKEKKPRKPLSKVQKVFIWIAVAIVVAGIIAASIAIPVTIANKDKIFVSAAEDFKNTDGKYYVLQKDVHVEGDLDLSAVTNIDFNGKKLIVKGHLRITSEGRSDVSLGKRAKNGYVKDGYIEAYDLIVTAPEANVNICADLMLDSMEISAASAKVISSVTVKESSSITAKSISIDDTFRFSTTEDNDYLNIINASTVSISGEISGNVVIKNGGVKPENGYLTSSDIKGNVKGNVYADNNTELIISSHIEGIIESCITDSEGIVIGNIGKVKVIGNAVVKEINNADLVYIHEKVVKRAMPELINVTKFDVIRQLTRVPYINVNDDTDTVIMEFGKVNNADKYIISIDGTEIETVTDTKVDITKYVKNVKTYLISVKAISEQNPELLLPSEEIRYEYKTFLTLARPNDIKVTIIDSKYILSYSKVSFADEYVITVNGAKITSEETSVDITEYLKTAGDYIIEITATSRNENIKQSKANVYQYSITEDLSSFNFTIQLNPTDRSLIFAWDEVANADIYEIVRVGQNGEETVLYRTNAQNVILSMDDTRFKIESGQQFKVIAKSVNSYYAPSSSAIVSAPFN